MSNTPPPIERASVEQADRTAAVHARQQAPWKDGMWDRAYKGGDFDDSYIVQMLARHRQQAHAAGVAAGLEQAAKCAERAAEMAEGVAAEGCSEGHVRLGIRANSARRVAAAIRKLSPGEIA